MKLKPLLNKYDFMRVLKNGDMKNKTQDEVVHFMEVKNFSKSDIAEVMTYCKNMNIKFKKDMPTEKIAEIHKPVQKHGKHSFSIYGTEMRSYKLLTAQQEKDLNHIIRKGKAARENIRFLDSNDFIHSLSHDSINFLETYYGKSIEELVSDYRKELALEVQKGKEARELFINSNLRLVISIARKHTVPGMTLDDLIQEGNIGLIKAVDKYEAERGVRFATMASWWIEQAITRGSANKSRVIRVPVHVWEKIQKIKTFEKKYSQKNGKNPDIKEYAKFLDTTPEKATLILNSLNSIASLDKEVATGDREGSTLGSMMEDKKTTEAVLDKVFLKDAISGILDDMHLQANEKSIFIKRFGLIDGVPKTLDELGKEFNMGNCKITNIVNKIREKFKTPEHMNLLKEFYAEI